MRTISHIFVAFSEKLNLKNQSTLTSNSELFISSSLNGIPCTMYIFIIIVSQKIHITSSLTIKEHTYNVIFVITVLLTSLLPDTDMVSVCPQVVFQFGLGGWKGYGQTWHFKVDQINNILMFSS